MNAKAQKKACPPKPRQGNWVVWNGKVAYEYTMFRPFGTWGFPCCQSRTNHPKSFKL